MRVKYYKTDKCRGKWKEHGTLQTSNHQSMFGYYIQQKCLRCNNYVSWFSFDNYREWFNKIVELNKEAREARENVKL